MQLRRPHRPERLGELSAGSADVQGAGRLGAHDARRWLVPWLACALLLAAACASSPERSVTHIVKSGENLYRIGLRYGVSSDAIARANAIRDVTSISIGTRLLIPAGNGTRARRGAATSAHAKKGGSSAKRSSAKVNRTELRRKARAEAKRDAHLAFAWPVKGQLTSSFGWRGGRPHEGIDMAARRGTPIFASESGKVIHSGRLGDYGKVVIVKHAGNFRSVYAHASKTLVRKGQFVERGQRIATVGRTGRATGNHLHFEIRRKDRPADPVLYLP